MSDDDLDCTTCGACCARRWSIPVTPEDLARMKPATRLAILQPPVDRFERLVSAHLDPTGVRMPLKRTGAQTRCRMLRGRVGRDATCSIYDERPDTCRAFEKGSAQCHEVRALRGVGSRRRAE